MISSALQKRMASRVVLIILLIQSGRALEISTIEDGLFKPFRQLEPTHHYPLSHDKERQFQRRTGFNRGGRTGSHPASTDWLKHPGRQGGGNLEQNGNNETPSPTCTHPPEPAVVPDSTGSGEENEGGEETDPQFTPDSTATGASPSVSPTDTPTFQPSMDATQDTSSPTVSESSTNGGTSYPTILREASPQGNGPTLAPSGSSFPSASPSGFPTPGPTSSAEPTTSSPPSTFTSVPTGSPTFFEFFANGRERDDMIQYKCGISTSYRTEIIMHALQKFSGKEKLVSGRSAQYRAFNWINRLDEGILCPEDVNNVQHDGITYPRILQRYSLAVFYFSTLGNDWTRCSAGPMLSDCDSQEQRWLSGVSECNWYGVTCNELGQVTNLDLPDNGLDGSLPAEIFSLKAMKGFSLGHNGSIRGSIPAEIAYWTELVYLDLDGNDLEGPFPNVYNTDTLQAIDLNNNRLSGTIDPAIGGLAQLVVLQIENNDFSGSFANGGNNTPRSTCSIFFSGQPVGRS